MDSPPNMDIAITVSPDDTEIREALMKATELNPEEFSGSGFDGTDVSTVVVSAGSLTLGVLAGIIKAYWQRSKGVVIKVGGNEVHGANPDEVVKILERLLWEERNKP